MAITTTKAYSNLVLQIRVAPISNSCGTYFGLLCTQGGIGLFCPDGFGFGKGKYSDHLEGVFAHAVIGESTHASDNISYRPQPERESVDLENVPE